MKRKSSILVSLLQQQYPRAISNSMKSINRTSKHSNFVSTQIDKRAKRRDQNRRAAERMKQRQQIIENNLHRMMLTLQLQHSQLQERIEQLNQRKQQLLYELNEKLFEEIDQLISDNENDFQTLFQSDLYHFLNNTESN